MKKEEDNQDTRVEAEGQGGEPGPNSHIDLYLLQIPRERKPRAVSTVHSSTALRGQMLIVAIQFQRLLANHLWHFRTRVLEMKFL